MSTDHCLTTTSTLMQRICGDSDSGVFTCWFLKRSEMTARGVKIEDLKRSINEASSGGIFPLIREHRTVF